jgi:hypothetical protein
MIDHAALLADLKRQVRVLEDDLRTRSAEVPEFAAALREEWQKAHNAERIGAGYEQWLEGEITQAAVAWILGTVFLRFCEDNELIELPYLAGPGERLVIAAERQQSFFEQNPAQTDRDWIITGFDALSEASSVAAGLFDRAHSPMWRITPSHDAAKALLAFWRTRGEGENSPVVHDFKQLDWDTRFLGDLYQELSEYAKKTYALLQTPEFVEEFILDLTLTPAIDEFGLEPAPPRARPDLPRSLRVIDPACGSGHFLLGAFARLLRIWKEQPAITDQWVLIRNVLDGLHGVDKNPFAVSIARFRLLIAAMRAGAVKHLADAPAFPLNIAVGDSLIHGRGAPGRQGVFDGMEQVHTFVTEDVGDYMKDCDILGVNSYHVVVGNPPYITVKDSAENQVYRDRYATCSGTYALSVPFAERFFNLACRAGGDRRGAGYVGQITSNSFMKREFGKKLIENFFSQKVDLNYVIDTSGAYIPGHGTPTVILVGRNMMPTGRSIRAALGGRGEPSQPEEPAKGHVWRAIVDQVNEPGSDSEWITVADLLPDQLAAYPWSLAGGGASDLLSCLAHHGTLLDSPIDVIGRTTHTGQDDAFYVDRPGLTTRGLENASAPVVLGEDVRDYWLFAPTWTLFPYDSAGRPRPLNRQEENFYWPNRTLLRGRVDFGQSPEERGLRWFDHNMFFPRRFVVPFSIAFAFVATHNHFVLDRGGKIFNRSAPVIKLAEGASEDDHLGLLGVLNSSAACFWLKQVSQDKGNRGGERSTARYAWESFFEFTGTKLEKFPLPSELPLEFGRELDGLAQRLSRVEPSAVCTMGVPTRERLETARAEHASLRGQMIARQEELDWEVYRLYGLLTHEEAADLWADPDSVPELKLGERAFEIAIAPKAEDDEGVRQWFVRHGSTPITEVPAHWPTDYRRVIERRIEVIRRRRDIALIERPECKRRWSTEPWEKKERAALRSWLLDRCEERGLWFAFDDTDTEQPRPMTVNRLADRLRDDGEFVSVARLYAGQDAELSTVVAEITDAEHVPYLAALRYKDTGLRKRRQWEETWDLQREEDATGQRLHIPVPPKYSSADFRKGSYWSHRGKLDVPKERFISYPQASPDGDGSMLLGWAGWDHRQQAHVLMTIIEDRTSRDGWATNRLVPLIAGLAEVLPWVRQWHGNIDPAFGISPADAYAGYLEDQQLRHGMTASDLTDWPPEPDGPGRRPASSTPASPPTTPTASQARSTGPVDTQIRHTPRP